MNALYHTLRIAGVCLGTLLWCASCSFHARYSESAEVSTDGWQLGDTLFFPIEAADSVSYNQLIAARTPYRLQLGVRHTNTFPYRTLRVQFAVEYLDSAGRPVATLLTQDILAPLTDDDARWNGSTWGSLYQKKFLIEPLTLSFPRPGHYRMRLVPDARQTPLPGLVSLTLTIPED